MFGRDRHLAVFDLLDLEPLEHLLLEPQLHNRLLLEPLAVVEREGLGDRARLAGLLGALVADTAARGAQSGGDGPLA